MVKAEEVVEIGGGGEAVPEAVTVVVEAVQ
jgi:hypothetical protein